MMFINMAFFQSIVKNFETIATSFVQQDNFTSFDATNNEIVFGAEKVLNDACSVIMMKFVCSILLNRFHWKPSLPKERVLQLKTMTKLLQT